MPKKENNIIWTLWTWTELCGTPHMNLLILIEKILSDKEEENQHSTRNITQNLEPIK